MTMRSGRGLAVHEGTRSVRAVGRGRIVSRRRRRRRRATAIEIMTTHDPNSSIIDRL
jgi:hypothetical protein